MKIDSPVMFVAEVSANHLGSLSRAKEIVRAAAAAGATAVKFQTYTASTMTLDIPEFIVSNDHSLWGGRRLFELYEEAHTPWSWHEELFSLSRELGLIPFSTPFDLTAVEFLETLNVPLYKIASLESGDHRLIKRVAETGKPLMVSTGATEWEEISEIVDLVRRTGNKNLTLLVCTSSYPSHPRNSHVRRIETLREEFGCEVGLSDHTLGIGASLAAISLGASVIEKHLTINRSEGGADAAFSMEPDEFAQLVSEGKSASQALGTHEWAVLPSETESRKLRRSLYIVKNVNKGDIVSFENVRAIRPGGGAHPRELEKLVGKVFNGDFSPGEPLGYDKVFNK